MTLSDFAGPPATDIPTYRGRGTRGWRLGADANDARHDVVLIEASRPFGGEWPDRQVWEVIDGQGQLTWDSPFARVRVTKGDIYRFEAGERRLLVAETTMLVRITPLE